MTNKITIEPVTRIEGHARVTLDIDDNNNVINGRLHVLEIRGFEKLLEHTELLKMPLITSRICGVCPAAHHLASAIAIENGLKCMIPERASMLRDLLYMGHILHSHALSCFVLTGPDLINGINSVPEERTIFSLLAHTPEIAKKMLRLRSIGQRIVETIGGRGVHPVTVIPGGIACQPDQLEMDTIAEWGRESITLIKEVYPVMKESLARIADLREALLLDNTAIALSNKGMVSFLKGESKAVDAAGAVIDNFDVTRYADHLIEFVTPGSYMKSVKLLNNKDKNLITGPLARLMVNTGYSSREASELFKSFKEKYKTAFSAIDNIEARLIEMIHCSEQITRLASQDYKQDELSVEIKPVAGRYTGMVEAPRGLLIHDYTCDDNGTVNSANLIVATQFNYDVINNAITKSAGHFKKSDNESLLLNGVEFAMRCFDPCLSCATHAAGKMPLSIDIYKDGVIEKTIQREVNYVC